ncbi:MAG: STAS domain-containing protein [Gemmatimonadetes bacterium]|nr:STAS domain-containing protein [Gemmatimonadota bacterium]
MGLYREFGSVIAVPDQLTIETCSAVQEAARQRLNGEGGDLILDLTETEAIDGTGLAFLITASQVASRRGSAVHVVGLADHLRALFRLARIEGLFVFSDGLEETLACVRSGAKSVELKALD